MKLYEQHMRGWSGSHEYMDKQLLECNPLPSGISRKVMFVGLGVIAKRHFNDRISDDGTQTQICSFLIITSIS